MAGEVDDRADQGAVLAPGADDADGRVDRPGRGDDVRVHLAGVRVGAAVFADEAALEDHAALGADAGVDLRRLEALRRHQDGRRQLPRHPVGVPRIRHRRVLEKIAYLRGHLRVDGRPGEA